MLKATQRINGRARVRTTAPVCPQPGTAGLLDPCSLLRPPRGSETLVETRQRWRRRQQGQGVQGKGLGLGSRSETTK